MVSELYLIKKLKALPRQLSIFYPFGLCGGEIVLCIRENSEFAKVLYCGELFTVPREYLSVWAS